MATCCFEKGQIVKIEGVEHMLLQRVGSVWQLQQSRTGLYINHPYSVLLRLFAESKLTFPGSIPTRQSVIANDETSPKFELAKVKRSYVLAVLNLPNSRGPIEDAIRLVWNRIKSPEKPPAWTSVYAWKSRYVAANQDIRALLDNSFNKGKRQSKFPIEVIEMCHKSIEARFMSKERNSIQDTLDDALIRVKAENNQRPTSDQFKDPPSRKLIRRLIKELPARSKCSARHGNDAARKEFRSVKGHIVTLRPFERAEIDHTVLDIFVVDDAENPKDRLPLGRPYVTACIDCYTRCILGIYVGFTPPSYQAVAACLKHCFTPKVNLKQEYPEIVNEWSAYGVMDKLVVDGGREFYSVSLDRACHFYNIDWVPSPRRTPWFKPHIERFMKTLNDNTAHGIPGTTFSNIFERGDYDPVKHAVISLNELKQNIYKWIVDVYHQKSHRSLGTSPAKMWASSVRPEDIRMPDELTRLDVALGRVYEGRRLSFKGVEFEGLLYNSADLTELRMREGANLVVNIRVDESNLGCISVTHPKTASEYSVPALDFDYANGVSLWLHKVLKNWQRKRDQPNQSSEGWLAAKAAIQGSIAQARKHKRLNPSKRRGRLDESLSGAVDTAQKRTLVVVPQDGSEEVIRAVYHVDSLTEDTADSDQSAFQDSEYPVFQATRRKEAGSQL